MTDLILLSGFLGAGKTTLLQHLLRAWRAAGSRVAVVSNDFGPVNVDAELIDTDGPIIEITDGSIFCSCREHEFVAGLLGLAAHEVDHLLVEASGLGDPANLGDLLCQVRQRWPELQHLGTVCVTDAEEVIELADLLPVVARQVACADLVLANKADLVTADRLDRVVAWLGDQNPRAEIVCTTGAELGLDTLLGLLGGQPWAGHGLSTNTCRSRPASIWLNCRRPVGEPELRAFLTELAGRTHRIKGFLPAPEGHWQVNAVGRRLELVGSSRIPRRPGLALITSAHKAFRSDVVRAWERTVQLPIELG